jgi:radical SAM protein with 4Fe4S-binding SPASM domain
MIAPPRQLVIETSGACNLKCPQCWVGLRWTNRAAMMSMDLFDKIVSEASAFVKHTYLHLWGEPTLNKHLPEMIRKVRAFSTVDLATHGLFIDEEMAEALSECDTLSVSIDGIDQETYEKYRVGGSLEKAMAGLRLLIKKCGHKVNWTFVVFKDNEHQLPAAQQIADEIGANIGFKPPLFWDRAAMDSSMPTDEKFRRYALVNGEWQLKADRLKCREFWETIYVLPNADVVTCCYDGAAEYVVGNVKDSTLLDVWNGETYNAMRRKHSGGMLNEMCSRRCQLAA